MTRVGGQRERERARLAEGKAEIWRSSCSIQLESSREIGRGRKRSTCVCVYVCVRVYRVSCCSWLRGEGARFFVQTFSSISKYSKCLFKGKIGIKVAIFVLWLEIEKFYQRLGGCKKINYSLHDPQLSFSSSFSPKFEDSNEGKIPTIWNFIL